MIRKDINSLEIYKLSMEVGRQAYEIAKGWSAIHRYTISYQLIRAVDSIAANISEGYGRFHYKEQRQFCYIARGSIYETNTWLTKAKERIPEDKIQIEKLLCNIHILLKRLNAYINYIEKKIN